MQMISREVLLRKGLPPHMELRKQGSLPPWFAQVCHAAGEQRAWWQVYLDNFMAGERCAIGSAGLNVSLQDQAMEAWKEANILTADDKQVKNSRSVVELGVRIDGVGKLLGVSATRLLKTCVASAHFLQQKVWSRRLTQIILGRWVFALQFRRAAMGVLSMSWEAVEASWPKPAQVQRVRDEVLCLMALAPLLQTDLTSTYDGQVTCSDASETGGAMATGSILGPSGRLLVSYLSDVRSKPIPTRVVVIFPSSTAWEVPSGSWTCLEWSPWPE